MLRNGDGRGVSAPRARCLLLALAAATAPFVWSALDGYLRHLRHLRLRRDSFELQRMQSCKKNDDCGRAGFCDSSVNRCICLPGWRGARCEIPYLGACRMHQSGLSAPCEGFRGVMSCQCRRDCVALHAVHGLSKTPFSAGDRAVCWTSDNHDELNFSGLPDNLAGVHFWMWERYFRSLLLRKKGVTVMLDAKSNTVFRWTGLTSTLNSTTLVPTWGPTRPQPQIDRMVHLVPEGQEGFLPNHRCPNSCRHRGSCYALVEGSSNDARSRPVPVKTRSDLRLYKDSTHGSRLSALCVCHGSYTGRECEHTVQAECLNGCNGHGMCTDRMCLCTEGWWGLDCSLSKQTRPRSTERPMFAPTYVLPLPTEWSMQHTYQGEQRPRRGMYSASRLFVERLHRRGHLMHGCLWEPQRYLDLLISFLRTTPPFKYYWSRFGGRDHVFFTTQDMGGCYMSQAVMSSSIIVSHFGFTGGMADFMSSWRWREAMSNNMNVSAALSIHHPRIKRQVHQDAFRARCSNCPLRIGSRDPIRVQDNNSLMLDSIAVSWFWDGARWLGSCFDASKDIITPPDFVLDTEEFKWARFLAQKATERSCNSVTTSSLREGRPTLLFMSGARADAAPWYSQGVRQEVWQRVRNASRKQTRATDSWNEVVFKTGDWKISELRKSQFCLCPSGWGFGWRVYLAVAMQCVPVVIQPLIEQAYHDLIPYSSFALFFDISQVHLLPVLLKRVPTQRVCELQKAAAKYYRAFAWEEPGGRAYEMLQLSLCHRATALYKRLLKGNRIRGPLPEWARCVHTSADDLLTEESI